MSPPLVRGFAQPGFSAVVEAFEANLADGLEIGAAFSAVVDGTVVVDLHAGAMCAEGGAPWAPTTLVQVFSGSKGLLAICCALLSERGLLCVDDPVATYWPEFSAHGKDDVTVAEVLSHRARLPALRRPVRLDDTLDPYAMAGLLADQGLEPIPQAAFTYHPLTMGWILAEILRRVDGRGVDRFVTEEIAAPLGLELHLGLGADAQHRVARLVSEPDWLVATPAAADDPTAVELRELVESNPPFFRDITWWNRPVVRAAVIPAAGVVATTRAMALLYGHLVSDGRGQRLVSPATLAEFIQERAKGPDTLTSDPLRYGLGFALQTAANQFGPHPDGFGHGGIGGSVHGAWPSRRTGFSYAMNRMSSSVADPRAVRLLAALADCVG